MRWMRFSGGNDEDIEALVDVLNISFGNKFECLQRKQQWSKFAMKGVVKGECGAQRLDDVWSGLLDWVKSLTT